MTFRSWWNRITGRSGRKPVMGVPRESLQEIVQVHERQMDLAQKLTLLGMLGTVPESPPDIAERERMYQATRNRINAMLEGERRAERSG